MPGGVGAGASPLLVTYGDPSLRLHHLPTVRTAVSTGCQPTCHLREAGEVEAATVDQVDQVARQGDQVAHQIRPEGTRRGSTRPRPISMKP